MDVAEVADIVGIDEDNLEDNFGELIAGKMGKFSNIFTILRLFQKFTLFL